MRKKPNKQLRLDPPRLLDRAGVAQLLIVSIRKVDRLANRPDFPTAVVVGHVRRWWSDEIETWLDDQKAA